MRRFVGYVSTVSGMFPSVLDEEVLRHHAELPHAPHCPAFARGNMRRRCGCSIS